MKRTLSIILAAVLLLSVFTALPTATSAATITRIDDFHFAINPNYLALKSNRTAGAWMNALMASHNGVGYGVSAAADTEGWKVDDVWGIYDDTLGRRLNDNEYPDLSHNNWLRVAVSLTDPENYAFNGNRSYTFPAYVNGLRQGGSPMDTYGRVDIRLYSYAYVPSVAFTVKEPMFGDQCSKYVPAVDTTMPFMLSSRIQITNWYWADVDPYTHWMEEVTSFTDPDADYAIVIEFTTGDGYFFGMQGTVTVNGEEAAFSQHGDSESGKTITRTSYSVPLGYTVSGKFTSYLNSSDATFISLVQNGEIKYTTNGYGKNEISYTIPGVAPGDYLLRVSKINHVSRDYAITVSGNTTQNVEICPKGDVDNDGEVSGIDAMLAYREARAKSVDIDDYAIKCADVDGEEGVSGTDVMLIFRQARGKNSLF